MDDNWYVSVVLLNTKGTDFWYSICLLKTSNPLGSSGHSSDGQLLDDTIAQGGREIVVGKFLAKF
jgi:hypothetical protein